ncbi:WG repeat-containing protein [Streptomyces sp. NPDC097619]|uniref:WG repeat-containing protein n=1 Tax=Streptomyces sp. NPDC097619 TaxID=3157228 RepID=UPI003328EE77
MPSITPPRAVPVVGEGAFGSRVALVGAGGQLVRPPEFSVVGRFAPDGQGGLTAPAATLDHRWGYLDGEGHWRDEPRHEKASGFDSAGRSRYRADGLWGYADLTGAPVTPARFTEAGFFHHELAVVRTEGGFGFVDPTGTVVLGGTHRWAGRYGPNGLAPVVAADGDRGYQDREGRLVVPVAFDEARTFNSAGTAPVRVGERWGLLRESGEWAVEPTFRYVAEFHANGLAYAIGEPFTDDSGFVDHRGEFVIRTRGGREDSFGHGLLKSGSGFSCGFLDATGRWVVEEVYEWADRFDAGGAAVARPAEDGTWGVLRADGGYVPSGHPEPLTDDDGWVVGFLGGTGGGHGLAAFRTEQGHLAYLDREGREVCRVGPDAADGSAVVLRDASGAVAWRAADRPGTFLPEPPFLTGDPESYLDGVPLDADPEPLVRELADRPARPFYPCSLIFGSGEDPYDLEGLDEHDLEGVSHGAIRVLASAWLAAELEAEYPFLEDNFQAGFGRIHDAFEEKLRARYGDPLPHENHCLRSGDGNMSLTWELDGRHLVLEQYYQVGDGDREAQIWLAVIDPED